MQTRCLGCMKEYNSTFDVCPYCGYVKGSSAQAKNHLVPGTVLADRYLMGKALGHGGFGITYIAWDERLKKTVAIKEYMPNSFASRITGELEVFCYNEESQRNFDTGLVKMEAESQCLARFNSLEGVVDVYDCIRENKTAYIIMEYLEGETLKQLLKQREKLTFEETVDIITPVLEALAQVHKENIIHRDIAPDNVFLCDDGSVKLLDFGSARDTGGVDGKSLSVILKPGYAPKEQYTSRSNQGPWTDVYAVSATIYRMLTGKPPFESLERDIDDGLKSLSEMGVDIPPGAELAIMKGLAINVPDRIQDAETLLDALLAAANGEDYSLSDYYSAEDRAYFRSVRKKRILVSLGVFAALAVILLSVFLIVNNVRSGEVILWNDDTVEALVRDYLEKPNGSVRVKELSDIESFEIEGGRLFINGFSSSSDNEPLPETAISSLDDFTNFPSLKKLKLIDGSISDLSPLISLTELTSVSIENNDISDLSPLEDFTQLTLLNLAGNNITDISLLRNIKQLRVLYLGNNKISDISPLASLTQLSELSLSSNNLTDINTLVKLTNLTWLELDDNGISDISVLARLVKLEYLYLQNNSISNIAPLSDMYSLTRLHIGNNGISSLEPISALPVLSDLSLDGNFVTELDDILDLTTLTNLSISNNPISDITPLSQLTKLELLTIRENDKITYNDIELLREKLPECTIIYDEEKLDKDPVIVWTDSSLESLVRKYLDKNEGDILTSDLSFVTKVEIYGNTLYLNGVDKSGAAPSANKSSSSGNISALNDFQQFFNLADLTVENNSIEDISPLSHVKSLTRLNLTDNDISSLEQVTLLKSLTSLTLDSNEITDVTHLAELTELTELSLSYNKLSSIEPLAALTKLERLELNGIEISDFTEIITLTALKSLSADENKIDNVETFAAFTALEELSLRKNNISLITPLAVITTLKILDLSNNSISDISIIAQLTGLTQLNLSNNSISSIDALTGLSSLESLNLKGNSINFFAGVRLRSTLSGCDITT